MMPAPRVRWLLVSWGVLSRATVAGLRCRAIAGAANNHLSDDGVAELLREREILWAPDFIANAGGAIQGMLVDVHGGTAEDVVARLPVIRRNLKLIFRGAAEHGTTTLAEAMRLVQDRLARLPPRS